MQLRSIPSTAMIALAMVAWVSGCALDAAPDVVRSIELTPEASVVAVGLTQAFKAESTDGDTRRDVSSDVTWSSSDTSLATVSATGVVRGLARGTVMIVASLDSATAIATVTITNAELKSISLSPARPAIARGTKQQFTATGSFSDGSTRDLTSGAGVVWSSSAGGLVTVDDKGLASGLVSGTCDITAKLQSVSATAKLTVTDAALVSLAIEPGAATLAKGTSALLKVTGSFSDGTTQDLTAEAMWSSSETGIAELSEDADERGTVVGRAAGLAVINAAYRGKMATANVAVTDATLKSIAITPATVALPKGMTQVLVATGTYSDSTTQDISSTVSWTSSDSKVAAVSNEAGKKGTVNALTGGATATIRASQDGVTSEAMTLTVTNAQLVSLELHATTGAMAKGTKQQLTASATYTDHSTQDVTSMVTWSTSHVSIASISAAGLVTAEAAGTAKITASLLEVASPKVTLTVTSAALLSLTLAPLDKTIAKGIKTQYTATGHFSDDSTQDLTSTVTWATTTSEASIANSGTKGEATGVSVGTTTVSASLGLVTGTTTLTVSAAVLQQIQVTSQRNSVAKGQNEQYTATGTYSDTTTRNITTEVNWASSSNAVATIGLRTGLALASGVGAATITATLGTQSGTKQLTVSAAELVELQVSAADGSIQNGATLQFSATGLYTDGSRPDVTEQVQWTSLTPAIVSISNAAGSRGLATARSVGGPVTIRATLSGSEIVAERTLTVTAPTLSSLTLTPTAASIVSGATQQYSVVANYSDGTHPDVTTQATWSSTNGTAASVDQNGLATAIGAGATTITVTFGGKDASALLTVTPVISTDI